MKRYEKYKPTGIQWLPEIPEHWKIENFGKHFTFGKGLPITKADLTKEGIAVISYGQVHSKLNTGVTLNNSLIRYVSPKWLNTNSQNLLNKCDFVFADTSEDIAGAGNCAFNDYSKPIFAGYHIVIARPTEVENSRYWAYLFQSNCWKSQVQSLVNGVKVYSINKSILKKSSVLIPSIAEQEIIVSYLDKRITLIENCKCQRERELQTLNELKQAEIASVVTRGLNPDVPMKDSGIPWIGQIPSHWETMRIRGLFKESDEKTVDESGTLLSLSQYSGITRKADAGKTGMFEAESTIGYKIVHPGQFVMNIMLAWNGSYAVSDLEGIISPAYCVFDFRLDCNKKYYDYLLRTKAYCGAFKTQSRGIIDSRLRLYPYKFYAFKTLVPPIEEQNAIVEYIESKTSKIDTMIEALKAEIDRLTEYKQRLISDVVTGQIDVRGEQI